MLVSDWSSASRSSSKRRRNNNQLISQAGTRRATDTTAEGRTMAASLGVSLHFIIEFILKNKQADGLFELMAVVCVRSALCPFPITMLWF